MEIDTWALKTPTQVRIVQGIIGQNALHRGRGWNVRAGYIWWAPLRIQGLTSSTIQTLQVTVASDATRSQVLAAEEAAAAQAGGVTNGVMDTPMLGKTYRAVWLIPGDAQGRHAPRTMAKIAVGGVNV